MAEAGLGPGKDRIVPRGSGRAGPRRPTRSRACGCTTGRFPPARPTTSACWCTCRASSTRRRCARRCVPSSAATRCCAPSTTTETTGNRCSTSSTTTPSTFRCATASTPRHAPGTSRRSPSTCVPSGRSRLELLRLGARRYALVLVVHHIAWDGMTWGSLSADLSALYRSSVLGEPDGLPAHRPVSLRRLEQGRPHAPEEMDYWRRRLDPPPTPLDLPADRPRGATASERGGGAGPAVSTTRSPRGCGSWPPPRTSPRTW